MENKCLNYLFSNANTQWQWRMTMMLKNEAEEESRSCVEVDLWPKEEGKCVVTGGAIYTCRPSFRDAIDQLRKSNPDYCDSDVWDKMEDKCTTADDINWGNITAGNYVLTHEDLT